MGVEFNAITLICVFLFIGAMGKSAQFFLHTWLPDAMEGPTPVSALIHAATMVTAGVFLVVRCSPIFEYSQFAMNLVAIIGMVTALFAASVALVQNDIKKIIAYSTCSQLGYMFFAAGVGAYHIAMFHLFTHAFFKALLFLGAGSVIHSKMNKILQKWAEFGKNSVYNGTHVNRYISSYWISFFIWFLFKRRNNRICLSKKYISWLLRKHNWYFYSIFNSYLFMEIIF